MCPQRGDRRHSWTGLVGLLLGVKQRVTGDQMVVDFVKRTELDPRLILGEMQAYSFHTGA